MAFLPRRIGQRRRVALDGAGRRSKRPPAPIHC